MVIVLGYFVVDPAEREGYMAAAQLHAVASRQDEGCVEFTIAADSSEPGRVTYVEVWRSAEHLAEHGHATTRRNLAPNPVEVIDRDFLVYEAGEPRPL